MMPKNGSTTQNIIKTRSICKSYAFGEAQVAAVKNIDIEIHEGEFTVVMGSSGSGKSSLLYLLSGLDRIDSGSIVFDNEEIATISEKSMALFRRKRLGFVFQAFHLVPTLSVMENVLLSARLSGMKGSCANDRCRLILEKLSIAHLADRLPSRISGGEQQRAAIARAVVHSPRALFADEPIGNLNSGQGQVVLDIFSALAQEGQTIVMVTHDVRSACRGDRILFMQDGSIEDDLTFDKTDDEMRREKMLVEWLTGRGW